MSYTRDSVKPPRRWPEIWTCPSCGWRQEMTANRPRICGRHGEPCPGKPAAEKGS